MNAKESTITLDTDHGLIENVSIEMHSIEGRTESLITIPIVKEGTEYGNPIFGHVPSG